MGYEGAMLKYPNAPYIGDRGRCWLKYKPTATYEGTITGFREGSGKNAGKLGSFEVSIKGETVYVGGGMSDAERKKFWAQRKRLLGRVLEFRVQADPRRVATARYPNFVRFRGDRKGG
jgi:ATP-dependent DNA ligase